MSSPQRGFPDRQVPVEASPEKSDTTLTKKKGIRRLVFLLALSSKHPNRKKTLVQGGERSSTNIAGEENPANGSKTRKVSITDGIMTENYGEGKLITTAKTGSPSRAEDVMTSGRKKK